MTYPDPYTPEDAHVECPDCGYRDADPDAATVCPKCGGRTRNLAVARE